MRSFLLMVTTVLLMCLFGCGNNDSFIDTSTTMTVVNSTSPNTNLVKVEVSESKGFGSVNPNSFASFSEKHNVLAWASTIENAEAIPGIVDIVEPEFDIIITDKDGTKDEYHLWIKRTGETSTLMNVKNTHHIFRISKESTDELRKALQLP